jgi:hypothetical protein
MTRREVERAARRTPVRRQAPNDCYVAETATQRLEANIIEFSTASLKRRPDTNQRQVSDYLRHYSVSTRSPKTGLE